MLPRRTTHKRVSRLRDSMGQNNQVSCQIRIQIDAKLAFVLPQALANKPEYAVAGPNSRALRLYGSATRLMNAFRMIGKYLFLASLAPAHAAFDGAAV